MAKSKEEPSKLSFISELEQWKSLFLQHQSNEQKSRNTLALDEREIDAFIEFCRSEEEVVRLEDISKLFMSAYFNHRREQYYKIHKRDISAQSLNIAISRLKVFFGFISDNHDEFLDLSSCMKKIRKIHTYAELPRFSIEENNKIALSLQNLSISIKQVRRRKILLAIALLFYGGLRSMEVLNLKGSDITLQYDTEGKPFYVLSIIGKGGKRREVPILKSKIESFEDVFLEVDGELFEFGYRAFHRSVQRFLKNAGVKNLSGNHAFRHNFASNLIRKNVNMQVISQTLGHSDISITARFYSRVALDNQMKALG